MFILIIFLLNFSDVVSPKNSEITCEEIVTENLQSNNFGFIEILLIRPRLLYILEQIRENQITNREAVEYLDIQANRYIDDVETKKELIDELLRVIGSINSEENACN